MRYLIINKNTDPAFNLALEEYFLTKQTGEFFCFWRNSPAVIIGRNQDALAEVDLSFLKANNIKLVRRRSGGGAVFHDLGNVNYTYIANSEGEDFCDFAHFSKPVISALSSLGVKAEVNGRNDLTVDGKKVSGNAQYVSHKRILHHGTLLFNSDFSYMEGALHADPRKLKGKGVASVRSRVTNISQYCAEGLDVISFIKHMEDHILGYFGDIEKYELTREDIASINNIKDLRYGKEEWNLLHMGKYSYVNSIITPSGIVNIGFNVKDGIISNLSITGDFFGKMDVADLSNLIIGTAHSPTSLQEKMQGICISDYILSCTKEDFISLFF